ncbi:UNVERIFIED_CONTAM: hypothetical protein FKN15_029448 [Acipenser sinensis]
MVKVKMNYFEWEQPIFSARAHVFQIDPTTKRNWIPASKHSLTVSFFYDATRNVYRIISVGGTKAIINSTITPNMTFTKTSQKFGQWADSRANTVYGLGFSSEQQLQQAIINSTITPNMTFTKTSQKFGQWADSRANTVYGLGFSSEQQLQQFSERFKEVKEAARLAREKSQDKPELSNPALSIAAPQDVLVGALRRSICELSWEAELFTLQDSNSKLVAALHEANANVEQWKKQLSAYQEETERLRDQVAELEAQGARHAACDIGKDELNQSLEELEAVLKAKDEARPFLVLCFQEVESRNAELERRVHALEQTLSNSLDERSRAENEVQRIIDILDVKIFDLTDLRQSLATLVHK